MREVLRAHAAGRMPPTCAAMELLVASRDASVARAAIAAAAEAARGERAKRAHAALGRLMDRHRAGCERIAAMLAAGVDHTDELPTVKQGLAFNRRLFDWSVRQSPEASVALHSLADPALLARVTRELVARMREWRLLGRRRDTLEIGCGIGRMQRALAPLVRSAEGLDISPRMVAEARRRCRGLANVRIRRGDGKGLGAWRDASLDLVYAVDSFPYLVQSGMELVAIHVAEAARVLRPGGRFLVLSFSYRADARRDRADFKRLCRESGLRVLRCGEKHFKHWDGEAFLAEKPAEKRRSQTI